MAYAMQAAAPAPAASALKVTLETLGDLKLYRLSEPVRIASKQQKFFEFNAFPTVEVEPAYAVSFPNATAIEGASARAVWHFQDTAGKGLGKPLPKGAVTLYTAAGAYWGDDALQADIAEREKFDLHGPALGAVVFDHWLESETRRNGVVERSHVLVLRNTLSTSAVIDLPAAAGEHLTLAAHETRRVTYDTSDRF